jgi:hypothetical protein
LCNVSLIWAITLKFILSMLGATIFYRS